MVVPAVEPMLELMVVSLDANRFMAVRSLLTLLDRKIRCTPAREPTKIKEMMAKAMESSMML